MSRILLQRGCALLIALLLTAFFGPARADLTGVTDIIPVTDYGANEADVQMPLAIDTNHLTGEYAVCYAFKGAPPNNELQCTRFDADNNVLSMSAKEFPAILPVGLMVIEAALNNDGQLYVLWHAPDSVTYLLGFGSDGTELFTPILLPGAWPDVSVATTPDYVWVGGWERITPQGRPEQEILTMRRYDRSGNFISVQDPFSQNASPLTACRRSDLVATTSGDVLLTWVIPGLPFGCFGTVYASTFTQDGTPIATNIQVSETVNDQNGNDISANEEPRAAAHENGEFVVSWLSYWPDLQLQAAAITFGGTVAVQPNDLIPIEVGDPFRVAGFPQNLDYFVFAGIGSPDPSCFLLGRLVFESDPSPNAGFFPGFCSMGFDIAFNQAGDMMFARFSNPDIDEAGQIEVAILPRPAEIEISPVSVSEGDPQEGIGNYATLSASLTRAHPLGEDVSFNYFTRDNTAFAGPDYQQTSDTLIFFGAQGQTEQVIQVPIVPDTEYEADEIFSVNLTGAINSVIKNGDESVNVTILNDDISPEILADCDAGDPTNCKQIQELGPGQFTETVITLTMAAPIGLPVNISFETQQGGPDPTRFAEPGSDYVDVSGTLQIPPGATQASFNVTVVGDDVPENTETFQVAFSAGSSINLPQPTLTLNILDDNLCFLELDTESLGFVIGGDTQQVELTTLDNTCQWTATPDEPWVSVDPASSSGSQTIQVTADPWVDPMGQFTRSAQVTIELTGGNNTGTETITIVQDGDCDFVTDPVSATFSAGAGSGSFTVTPSNQACEWNVFTDEPWINISSPASFVTGTGTVQYTVSSNGSTNVENDPRMTTLNSDFFDFDIAQDGCVFDVDPSTVSIEASGNEAANVNVLAGPTACQWSAVSNSVWIIIADGASGSGDGSVTLDVIENPSVVPRVGSITIADQMVTFEQEGQPCDFEASPGSINFCPDGDNFTVDVTALAGCEWSLSEEEDWIAVINNASGSGDETATGLVDANLSETNRATTVQLISTSTGLPVDNVQIQQQGFLEYEPFDGPLPTDWLFDPMNAFSTADGELLVDLSAGGSGLAVHQNPMGTCSDCKVETSMEVTSVTSQSEEVATLAGWYTSDDDYIGLGMDEFANMWSLYQVSGGVVVASESIMVAQILPNQSYDVGIRFDGTTFRGFVDGVELLTIDDNADSTPFGYAGFMVTDSDATFTELRVTGIFQEDQSLLSDSFEDEITELLSVCTQE